MSGTNNESPRSRKSERRPKGLRLSHTNQSRGISATTACIERFEGDGSTPRAKRSRS